MEEVEREKEWEIESWADTLLKAEEIKQDKKKMEKVAKLLKKKKKAITSISDLKDAYNDLPDEDED